jgi:hypothetical protein
MLLKGPRRFYSLEQGRYWSKNDNKGFTQCFNDTSVHNGHGATMKEFVNVVAEALEITCGGYTPTVIKQDNTCKVPNPDPNPTLTLSLDIYILTHTHLRLGTTKISC